VLVTGGLGADGLLEAGLDALRAQLGDDWTVAVRGEPSRSADALVEIESPDRGMGGARFLVDLKSEVTPRGITEVLVPKRELIQQVGAFTSLLVIAPWISGRSQEMLRDAGINYVDLTGNVSVRSTRPAIAVRLQGATRSPHRTQPVGSNTTVGGTRAGRLVRALVDVAPPYRLSELAALSGLSLSYVSKLVDTLTGQLLVRREGRLIVDVDWQNLLRSRAEHENLLKNNPYVGAIAPNGIPAALAELQNFVRGNSDHPIVVTGSFAARKIVPMAVGGQLMLYVAEDFDAVQTVLGLLPTSEGADVLLLRPKDDVVFTGTRIVDGLPHVALSQLALDCLSGTGRMPAEGEAVISYMAVDESNWRAGAV
jgi:hypothetical protein